jgi:MFS family permease
MPYLINAVGSPNWRNNMLFVSLLSLVSAAIIGIFVKDGPNVSAPALLHWRQVKTLFHERGLRLANMGYFGHMWELYAMWTWMPVMIRASFALKGNPPGLADLASFAVMGFGAAGCIAGGVLADRIGRTVVTSAAMILSGSCCIAVGFVFGAHPALMLTVATIWGASVVADSAQFSTCITELSDPSYIGTALTIQTCVGFLLTTISIQIIPLAVQFFGWKYAFIALAPGPVIGTIAMLRLRGLPEASKLAHGRR